MTKKDSLLSDLVSNSNFLWWLFSWLFILENMALDDCQLRIVARHLVVNRLYREVARDFELKEPDIEIVKYDHQNDTVQEISYQMLLKIKKKKERITLGNLRKSVQKHDNTAWNGILQDLQS